MRASILAIVVLAFSVNHAFAVSLAVKLACRDDYFAHCSMHAVGSPGVRQCMRKVGARLSQRCIGALADAGEIKKAKVAKVAKVYKKKQYAKKSVAKTQVARNYDTRKKYATEAVAKKQYASRNDLKKRDLKKRYAKKRYAKKQYTRLARG